MKLLIQIKWWLTLFVGGIISSVNILWMRKCQFNFHYESVITCVYMTFADVQINSLPTSKNCTIFLHVGCFFLQCCCFTRLLPILKGTEIQFDETERKPKREVKQVKHWLCVLLITGVCISCSSTIRAIWSIDRREFNTSNDSMHFIFCFNFHFHSFQNIPLLFLHPNHIVWISNLLKFPLIVDNQNTKTISNRFVALE